MRLVPSAAEQPGPNTIAAQVLTEKLQQGRECFGLAALHFLDVRSFVAGPAIGERFDFAFLP